mgnify:CR=1 FL=1
MIEMRQIRFLGTLYMQRQRLCFARVRKRPDRRGCDKFPRVSNEHVYLVYRAHIADVVSKITLTDNYA